MQREWDFFTLFLRLLTCTPSLSTSKFPTLLSMPNLTSAHILLRRMRFYAYHGVLSQENTVGGDYAVSVELRLRNLEKAVWADRLESTVNYAEVYALVSEEMAVPSALLEHVAGKILRRLFSQFRQVEEAEVTVEKICPPMGAQLDSAAVVLRAHTPFAEKLRLLVLDFDGTVADTSQTIIDTMTATFRETGRPIPSPEAISQTIGLPLTASIASLSGLKDKEEVHGMTTVYRRLFERQAAVNIRPFPLVRDTIRTVAEAGIPICIATSRGHQSVERLCQQIGIAPYIGSYVAEEDVIRKKPEPEAVEKLMEKYHVHPEETLVVGDTTFDILMGKAAGCPTFGVTYGNHSRKELAAAGADILSDHFSDILPLLCGQDEKD